MAFDQKLEKKSRGLRNSGGADVRLNKSIKNGSLSVNISGPVADALSIKRGDSVSIMVGTGVDDGRFAIVRGGEFKVSPQGRSKRFRVACSSLLPHIKLCASIRLLAKC